MSGTGRELNDIERRNGTTRCLRVMVKRPSYVCAERGVIFL